MRVSRARRATPDGEGRVLVGDEAREAEAVERAAPMRPGQVDIPGEGRRDEEVGGGEVAAPRALEPRHLPVVVDLHGRGGEHDGVALEHLLAAPESAGRGRDPARVANAAGERPPPGHAIAAGHADGLARGHEDPGGARRAPAIEHLGDGLVGEKDRRQGEGSGADHHAPGRRGVDGGHGLDDLELRHRVGLRAAQHLRKLEGQEPGLVEGVDGGERKRTRRLGGLGPGHHHGPHALDGLEQGLPLLLAVRRERSRAASAGRSEPRARLAHHLDEDDARVVRRAHLAGEGNPHPVQAIARPAPGA